MEKKGEETKRLKKEHRRYSEKYEKWKERIKCFRNYLEKEGELRIDSIEKEDGVEKENEGSEEDMGKKGRIGRDEKSKCGRCDDKFRKESEVEEHTRVKHVTEFECVGCGEEFASKNELGEHGRKVHVGLDEKLRENDRGLEKESEEMEIIR